MGRAGGHPDHVILIVKRLVIFAVLSQSRVVDGAVREFTLRIAFIRVVTGHPQLFIHKAQAMVDPLIRGKFRAGCHRVGAARVGDNLIRDRVAHAVLFTGVAQQANGARVKFLCRLLFGINVVLIDLHGTGARATGGIGFHFRIHRHQLVVNTIDIHIKTEVIDVLVRGAHNVVVNQRAVTGIVFGGGVMHGFGLNAFHGFDTRRASINAEGAVLMEYPVEDVIVVTDGTHPAHHQFTTLGADVWLTHLLMLVFRPRIAFENGDCARDLHRRAGIVRDGFIEHHGVGRHVFTPHQRRGQGAHAVVAGVEIGFKVPAHVRIAVRDNHAAERPLIHHLTFLAVVVIRDG